MKFINLLGQEKYTSVIGQTPTTPIILGVLILAYLSGSRASPWLLLLLFGLVGIGLLIHELRWGLLVIPAVALLSPLQLSTGTDVPLTSAVLIVPPIVGLWLIHTLLQKNVSFYFSRLYWPLLALGLLMLFSLIRGNLMWEPFVPKPTNLLLIQLGQLTIYYFSFLAFLLMANLTRDLLWLRWITYGVLAIGTTGAGIVLLYDLILNDWVPIKSAIAHNVFMIWLVGLSLSLAIHDNQLQPKQRMLLNGLAILSLVIVVKTWFIDGDWIGGWAPPLITTAVILTARYPKLRVILLIVAILLLIFIAIGDPLVLETGYWQQKWVVSGGSRLALWQSIVELAIQSPVWGLGIIAYRYYHFVKPLTYLTAYWSNPAVSAHNMWVDLFAQLGIIGVILYAWFLIETMQLAWRLYKYSSGFMRAYAVASIGALAGMIFADILAETSLPFMYNLGFQGFRSSVVSWMLLGGLVVLEQVHKKGEGEEV